MFRRIRRTLCLPSNTRSVFHLQDIQSSEAKYPTQSSHQLTGERRVSYDNQDLCRNTRRAFFSASRPPRDRAARITCQDHRPPCDGWLQGGYDGRGNHAYATERISCPGRGVPQMQRLGSKLSKPTSSLAKPPTQATRKGDLLPRYSTSTTAAGHRKGGTCVRRAPRALTSCVNAVCVNRLPRPSVPVRVIRNRIKWRGSARLAMGITSQLTVTRVHILQPCWFHNDGQYVQGMMTEVPY